jgi:hypothetical protein
VRRFDRNSAIAEDDIGDYIVIIRFGLAKVCSLGVCRPVLLALRGPGDIVGEMASISGQGCSTTVIAIDRVDVLVIEAARFHRVLSQFPHRSAALQQVLVARFRESDSEPGWSWHDERGTATGAAPLGVRTAQLRAHGWWVEQDRISAVPKGPTWPRSLAYLRGP